MLLASGLRMSPYHAGCHPCWNPAEEKSCGFFKTKVTS
jgi:hypothetical protein